MQKTQRGRRQESARTGEGYALAEWLNTNLNKLTDKTNNELADELGYTQPNIISMWRTGRTKVPLDRIFRLADILSVNVTILLPLWAEQYGRSDGYEALQRALSRTVTEDEMHLVSLTREKTLGRDFKLAPEARQKLHSAIVVE